eukprot:TRINITY_DN16274_c0_g2_i1.p1 TRINITY_DN16274_c0_g2~~TRINITY_DN16274_c0_g2_i1.p1  ORF type:complete len:384 (+),score=55.27 TRINITY_DN16274_c0_g2_i1:63-1214(+)
MSIIVAAPVEMPFVVATNAIRCAPVAVEALRPRVRTVSGGLSTPPAGLMVPHLVSRLPSRADNVATSVAAPAAVVTPRQKLAAPLTRQSITGMPLVFSSKGIDGPRKRILCYGDSLTAGFCGNGQFFAPYGRVLMEELAAQGIACDVFVCGHSGRTAQEMVLGAGGSIVDVVGLAGKGLERILAEDGPFDSAIIMAGTNDMGVSAPHEAIIQSVSRLHMVCHARGVSTIGLAPPPALSACALRESNRRILAGKLHEVSSRLPGVRACADPGNFVPVAELELWEADGLHFTPAGSARLGQKLAKLVAEHLAPVGGTVAAAASVSSSDVAARCAGDNASTTETAEALRKPRRQVVWPQRCAGDLKQGLASPRLGVVGGLMRIQVR